MITETQIAQPQTTAKSRLLSYMAEGRAYSLAEGEGKPRKEAIYSGIRGEDLTFVFKAGTSLIEMSANPDNISLLEKLSSSFALNQKGMKGLTNPGYRYQPLPADNPLLLRVGESGVLKALAEAKL